MITITHRITATKAATTLRMPGRESITKTWIAQRDGSYKMDARKGWEDEGLPDEVLRAVDQSCTSICATFSD
ncbi:hypothetical protein NQ359_24010 [Escherichia coli]|jgi:hypothetical protein|nr:hypothetical protein [Escherichia coli]